MKQKLTLTLLIGLISCPAAFAQNDANNYLKIEQEGFGQIIFYVIALALVGVLIYQYIKFRSLISSNLKKKRKQDVKQADVFSNISATQIDSYLKKGSIKLLVFFVLSTIPFISIAQDTIAGSDKPLISQPGIIITLFLLAIPLLLAAILLLVRANNTAKKMTNEKKLKEAQVLAENILATDNAVIKEKLIQRKKALDYALSNTELGGTNAADDSKGVIQNVSNEHAVHFTATKKKADSRPSLPADITKLIVWYLGCAALWLLIGSGIGEYVGIKFVAPDADHISWLSFGRLRPVHTNMVFWGWASLGILGLGYYIVPTVSNTKIYSVKWGWISLVLVNLMVILGTISLMAGINNGGGEFREYIWPITALFAVALILTVINFWKTIAKRTTKEIYISNWYIMGALLFTIVIALTAYLPFWQNGLGETIIQGYYMHSGVGMWFTLFTLGLLYYFIPQQLNKAIYAYSLGILAFWTQIIFYTIIGTHHFVFSSIPWWLQTVAIVGSAGMIIPVIAATINFSMTFKGQWNKVSNSYTLPFFLTAVVYYFVVSMQGTAEAFRYTNLLWHFTDFTVAHSHLGFYGIITFAVWGGTYAILPRLTGKEPPQHMVGAHFWIAFVGLLLYCVPLMIGGTIKGLMWMNGEPFINSVVKMFDYWIWRAIGGSLMFLSHIIYFYNFYKMTVKQIEPVDVKEEAFKIIASK